MDIKKLQETRIVTKGEHFIPLVLADITIPAAFAAGATYAGKEIRHEWDNRKKKWLPTLQIVPYRMISANQNEKEQLIKSIDDIQF